MSGTQPLSSIAIIPDPIEFRPYEEPSCCLGNLVHWIKVAPKRGKICTVITFALTFFLSLVLTLSVVGIPLVILGVKELCRQNAEEQRKIDQKDIEGQYVENFETYKTGVDQDLLNTQADLQLEKDKAVSLAQLVDDFKNGNPVLANENTVLKKQLTTTQQTLTETQSAFDKLKAAPTQAPVVDPNVNREYITDLENKLQEANAAVEKWREFTITQGKEKNNLEVELNQLKANKAPSSPSEETEELHRQLAEARNAQMKAEQERETAKQALENLSNRVTNEAKQAPSTPALGALKRPVEQPTSSPQTLQKPQPAKSPGFTDRVAGGWSALRRGENITNIVSAVKNPAAPSTHAASNLQDIETGKELQEVAIDMPSSESPQRGSLESSNPADPLSVTNESSSAT